VNEERGFSTCAGHALEKMFRGLTPISLEIIDCWISIRQSKYELFGVVLLIYYHSNVIRHLKISPEN
jgi:hypothetical protein